MDKPMTNLDTLLNELEQARKNATPGPWFDSRTTKAIQVTHESPAFKRGKFNIATYPTRTNNSLLSHEEWDSNPRFIVLAANNILKLIEVCRVMKEALKCNQTYHTLGGIDDCEPCKALAKVQEICKGGGE